MAAVWQVDNRNVCLPTHKTMCNYLLRSFWFQLNHRFHAFLRKEIIVAEKLAKRCHFHSSAVTSHDIHDGKSRSTFFSSLALPCMRSYLRNANKNCVFCANPCANMPSSSHGGVHDAISNISDCGTQRMLYKCYEHSKCFNYLHSFSN